MARTRRALKPVVKPVITWTRFHLPREQQWPTWPVNQTPGGIEVRHGPLRGVPGCTGRWLGRMVDHPEQAAYIIQWATPDDVKNFQSSPACAEFLQNLPDDSQVSINSGLGLEKMTISEASSSSSAPSRFLLLRHLNYGPNQAVEERVTLTAFLIPGKVDNMSELTSGHLEFGSTYRPRGYESLTFHSSLARRMLLDTPFEVLSEDGWVEKKFGKLEEQTADDGEGGRTIICHFHLWRSKFGGSPELEAASVGDPQTTKSWNEALARVMPPATDWVQERWDIEGIPPCKPPSPEPPLDAEELEEELEQQRAAEEMFKEYRMRLESGEISERRWCATRF